MKSLLLPTLDFTGVRLEGIQSQRFKVLKSS